MQLLDQHPRLSIFKPLIFLVQEDLVVSLEEENVIEHYLNTQLWLNEDEKKVMRILFTPGYQFQDDLNKLKMEIRYHLVKNKIRHDAGIIEIGCELVYNHRSETWYTSALAHQHVLGFLNFEALYHFYPEWRDTQSLKLDTESSFDAKILQSILDGKDAGLIRELKNLFSHDNFNFKKRDEVNAFRTEIYHACSLLAAKGYGAISYPEPYGGCNDMSSYFCVMETLSMVDLSLTTKFGVQFGLFGGSILNLGTKKHHDRYLKSIGILEIPGCFAMSETGHGSNVKGIQTTAQYQHQTRTFIIHTPNIEAQKDYIGNAALHGQLATVFAKLIVHEVDYGVAAFLVPIRSTDGKLCKGVTITDCGVKMGLNGVDNGRIKFDHVSIPYDSMLDRFVRIDENGIFQSSIQSENKRFFTMLGTLVGGRIGVPRSALTASKIGLATAIRYSNLRKQFGPEKGLEVPILNYRMHQRRLLPRLAKTYALHFALRYITEKYVQKDESEAQEIEAIAAGIKAYATWHNTDTLQECRECCGGKGFLSENRIDDLKNDSDVYTTFEGDNTVLMQLVAKSRLTEFKQSFYHIGVTGYVKYFASQAYSSVSQKNPIAVRITDEDHLLDHDFHHNAFKYREQDILTSVAKRLKRLLDDGMDSFDAFNVCQHHLIEAAEAYVERIVLEQFYLAISNEMNTACHHVLLQLYNLYALYTIEAHKEWYLESEYMAPVKTKAIRKLVNQLCWDLRKEAVPLVDAFGIPDKYLGVIGRN